MGFKKTFFLQDKTSFAGPLYNYQKNPFIWLTHTHITLDCCDSPAVCTSGGVGGPSGKRGVGRGRRNSEGGRTGSGRLAPLSPPQSLLPLSTQPLPIWNSASASYKRNATATSEC